LLYDAVRDFIENYGILPFDGRARDVRDYVVIHSRSLEGGCEIILGERLPKDECWMSPSYVKRVMGGTVDRPVVFIGDGQNRTVLENLRNDPDIGPALIVADDLVAAYGIEVNQPWSDMVVAWNSDLFIGTRVSTFATVVGVSRVLSGADPASNYLYTNRTIDDRQGVDIEVCESCLFLCDEDETHLCGHEPLYN